MVMKFYSLPPVGTHHPFLLVNYKRITQLKRRPYEHAILDCGISIFHGENMDYPEGFHDKYHAIAKGLKNGWAVIPDVPDDHHPQENNIERTIRTVQQYTDQRHGVDWVPVLQSKVNDINSFRWGISEVKRLGLDLYNVRLGIGTVCKVNDLSFIRRCAQVARREYPDSHIHMFGLTLRALPRVIDLVNSWDSMAYTFPRETGGHSAKNKKERVEYWRKYLKRINELLPTRENTPLFPLEKQQQ